MAYIGRKPTNAPLTSSDIADGIISTVKIADSNVTSAKILDGTIASDDLASGVGGSMVKLSSATASNSANITFDSSVITSTYKYYQIHCIDVVIQTDGESVKMHISTNYCTRYITSKLAFPS